MRKIFTLLFSLLLAANLAPAFAQNIYIWNTDGSLSVLRPDNVDSVSFHTNGDLYYMTVSDEKVGDTSFEATATVSLDKSVATEVNMQGSELGFGIVLSACDTPNEKTTRGVALGDSCGVYKFKFEGLEPGMTYYYRLGYGILDDTGLGKIHSFTTTGTKAADKSKTVNGHRFVDLGLPSGTLWAETNLGAPSAEDAGNYYAWGETATKDNYTRDNSTWFDKQHEGDLTAAEDAATAAWGEGVSMPTRIQMVELSKSDNCAWTWKKVNGVQGYEVTSEKNGNKIFLPIAGLLYEGELHYPGTIGYYWASTPDELSGYPYYFYLSENYSGNVTANNIAYFGVPVRPVTK